ncbi:unnamed protein product [Cylindrotheca closterium]|uniref:Pentatricopeptide repeat-containing protein-mitochondrial domain-containing protein n=1 Tax=Cylindrotheca closterium TaxID=2856 RepID=A0AAD2G101_9STRA|nr:unnamed protein product [Cylindrotheca closterium]
MFRIAEFLRREKLSLLRRLQSSLKSSVTTSSLSVSRENRIGSERLASLDPFRTHRREQKFAARDNDHREAMKVFLDSLNAALSSSSLQQSEIELGLPTNSLVAETIRTPMNNGKEGKKIGIHPNESFDQTPEVEERTGSNSKIASQNKNVNRLNLLLSRAVRRKNVQKSVTLFEQAVENDQLIEPGLVSKLFFLVSKSDPIAAYENMRYYHLHPDTSETSIDMYRRLCNSVASLDPRQYPQRKMVHFVECLLRDLEEMENDQKAQLLPNLIVSLVRQRSVSIGPYANTLYDYMISNEMEMTPGWLNKLLSSSKYNRQEDLPFHDVLARLISKGFPPHPLTSIPVVHNMFPYTDTQQMRVALQALLDLHASFDEDVDPSSNAAMYEHYKIDRSTLEMISTGAAQKGDPELIMLVWEVLETLGYNPTEHLFENTIVAFACNESALVDAFAAVSAMKEAGFEVSRALIRSVSRAIRSKRWHVTNAFELLTESNQEDLICLENFNIVMSSYAERGDVNDVLRVMQTIRDIDLQPNQDSYAFAMEVLGKDLHRRKSSKDKSLVHKNIEKASSLLASMEEEGVQPSADFVRNYVELLCMGNELNTATELIQDCLATDGMRSVISNKTLYRAAIAHADVGNMDIAKGLAAQTSELIPVLIRKIKSKEQRFLHLKSIR